MKKRRESHIGNADLVSSSGDGGGKGKGSILSVVDHMAK